MLTPEFEVAYRRLIEVEGGYVFDPDDPGGETYKGISRKNWVDWEGWTIVDEYKSIDAIDSMNNDSRLLLATKRFYKEEYWDRIKGDSLEFNIACKLFDIAVNMGINTAGIMFQRSLNILNRNQQLFWDISVDGIIGVITINAYNALPYDDLHFLLELIKGMQLCRYIEITEDRETLEKYIRGWMNRV